MKIKVFIFVFFVFVLKINAQNELLNELENEMVESNSVNSVFKGLKIVNLESTKLVSKGDLYFIIAHRFGSIKGGVKELFGLDQSNIRFSFIYGFRDWFNLGLSRSSFDKTYDITSKIKLLSQEKQNFPLTIVGFGAVSYKTADVDLSYVNFENIHRLNYLAEILISRKINENLSLEVAPIFIHENFTPFNSQQNSQFAAGFGGRYKLTKRLTLNMDYVSHLNRTVNNFKNPFSVGVDIETGGHVFQLHLTNSQQMNDAGFVNANGNWASGDVFLGFNLSRVF